MLKLRDSLVLRQALGEGGKLVACESDERPLDTARAAFEAAGVSCKVTADLAQKYDLWPDMWHCLFHHALACDFPNPKPYSSNC